ncbi:MAG TPA: TIGR03936 family radical SAM-associated protein [Jiangellaceae bacterium]|nr:TIGR03936 family radical SAM-associated protein [Jiangellaceae bacterium]
MERTQAPPIQKLRIRFAKRGRLRFTSHRDFQRAFERALRRAQVPVAFSQGFTPHPKVSYAGAAPTGAASEAEYLEIAVTAQCDPAVVAAALDDALPPGLDIVDVVAAGPVPLADQLQASEWAIDLPEVTREELATAIATFLAEPVVEIERMTKNGVRTLDARGAVVRMAVGDTGPTLRLVVRHQTPTVRPDDILVGLRRLAGLHETGHVATRLAQGPLDEATGSVGDPFVATR